MNNAIITAIEAFHLAKAALQKTPPDVETAEKLMEYMLKADAGIIRNRIEEKKIRSDANRTDKGVT